MNMVRKGKEKSAGNQSTPAVGEGQLYVTAQQSRYALDAVDAPNSKEVGECSSELQNIIDGQ